MTFWNNLNLVQDQCAASYRHQQGAFKYHITPREGGGVQQMCDKGVRQGGGYQLMRDKKIITLNLRDFCTENDENAT